MIESSRANCFVWGSVLLLCALPWPAVRKQALWNADQVAKHKRQEASALIAHKERFAHLTIDSPLSEWLEFAGWDSDLRNEALQGIRRLPRRQAEAEELLAKGEGAILESLPMLELQATPALCLHASRFLCDFVKSFAKPAENPNSLPLAAHRLERYANALQWFFDHKGDISPGLNCIADFARLHPDSPERQEILARLSACSLKK
jgi:hypothetical protein